GETVKLAVVTDELESLVAYLQKLGANRGKWRDLFEPQNVDFTQVSLDRSDDWIEFGEQVYIRRCAGCHGVEGDGNGPAATFMYKDRPRDFTKAVFKFRSTGSDSLPTDGDILRTITRGVRGTSMPSWHMLSEKERLSVVQYIKYKLAVDRSDPQDPYVVFEEEEAEAPAHIGRPPEPSPELVATGKEIWKKAKCWECHGDTGKGDGEKAAGLKDDNKFSIVPADLTVGQFKSGASVKDIFRSISTGLSGTPMPSYSDSFDEDERWALSYYVLSLSAFTDPLTKKPLNVSDKDRQALNDPGLKARRSAEAYGPGREQAAKTIYGGNAWARRRGFDMVGKPGRDGAPNGKTAGKPEKGS
ncbi:MAG: c-type cytochrome, partial [Methyloligellaceae bacterium]